MEKFLKTSEDFKPLASIILAATFGIFLFLGNAWSSFLSEIFLYFIPKKEYPIIGSFIYAVATTFISTLLLCVITNVEKKTNKRVVQVSKSARALRTAISSSSSKPRVT